MSSVQFITPRDSSLVDIARSGARPVNTMNHDDPHENLLQRGIRDHQIGSFLELHVQVISTVPVDRATTTFRLSSAFQAHPINELLKCNFATLLHDQLFVRDAAQDQMTSPLL